MNKQLFIAICDRINTLPEIAWVDADENQLNATSRPPLGWPAALVDISYPACETHVGGRQKIKARIEIRVAFHLQGQTNASAPTEVRQRALSRFDTLERIHQKLQWWNGGGLFNPLRRISSMPEKRADGLKVYKIIYETEFFD